MRFDDQGFLAQAYSTDEQLAVRIETHRRYGVNPKDLFEAITEQALSRSRPARILDVGAGNGSWYRALRRVLGPEPQYVGLDQSAGMVERLQEEIAGDARAAARTGDAQALPWTEPQFDWVGMHFMLYHVPDIRRAIGEAWRVLSPGGLLLAATTSPTPYSELLDVLVEGLREMGYAAQAIAYPAERFSLAQGGAFFPAPVEKFVFPAGFRFDAVEPALRYLASGPLDVAIAQAGAPAAVRGDLVRYVGERVAVEIAQRGSFLASAQSGFFLLAKPAV